MQNFNAVLKEHPCRLEIESGASSLHSQPEDSSFLAALKEVHKPLPHIESKLKVSDDQIRNSGGRRQKPRATFFFGVGSISLSKRKRREGCTLEKAVKHNLREIAAERGGYGRIDPNRSHLNEYLVGSSNSAEVIVVAAKDACVPHLEGKKLRIDHTQAIELVFSLPDHSGLEVRKFFLDCVAWTKKSFAGQEIYSAVIHHDESAPHCHVLISPIRKGVRVGSTVIKRERLSELRQKFWCEIAAPAGLAMPSPKLRGRAKYLGVQRVLNYLAQENEPCIRSRLWPAIRASIGADPTMSLQVLDAWGEGELA